VPSGTPALPSYLLVKIRLSQPPPRAQVILPELTFRKRSPLRAAVNRLLGRD